MNGRSRSNKSLATPDKAASFATLARQGSLASLPAQKRAGGLALRGARSNNFANAHLGLKGGAAFEARLLRARRTNAGANLLLGAGILSGSPASSGNIAGAGNGIGRNASNNGAINPNRRVTTAANAKSGASNNRETLIAAGDSILRLNNTATLLQARTKSDNSKELVFASGENAGTQGTNSTAATLAKVLEKGGALLSATGLRLAVGTLNKLTRRHTARLYLRRVYFKAR